MESSLGDSCGYRFQPGATRLTTDLTWGCARVTSVTYRRQTRGEWVKGHDCFGREFEKGVECEATGIMCVALRCVCIYIYYINCCQNQLIRFIYITSPTSFTWPTPSTSTSSTSHTSPTSRMSPFHHLHHLLQLHLHHMHHLHR